MGARKGPKATPRTVKMSYCGLELAKSTPGCVPEKENMFLLDHVSGPIFIDLGSKKHYFWDLRKDPSACKGCKAHM